ncbi:MAG: hypothetical protein P8Y91_00045 [Desulfuromonadales bacterium]
MKPFVLLLTALMLPALSFAQQALVLTEIEQIQEKVWYLQRDLAAQQKVLDKQQGVLTQLADKVAGIENSDTTQVTALQEMLTDQGQSLQGLESALQSFEKTLSTLQEDLRQQQAAQSAAAVPVTRRRRRRTRPASRSRSAAAASCETSTRARSTGRSRSGAVARRKANASGSIKSGFGSAAGRWAWPFS